MDSLLSAVCADKVCFTPKKTRSNNPYHVAFGVDDRYTFGMGVCLISLVQNNPDIFFSVHILTKGLSEQELQRIQQLAHTFDVAITIYLIKPEFFAGLPALRYFSHAIYNRLLIPILLQEEARQVLYLDADMICLASVRDLKLKQGIAAVVADSPQHLAGNLARLGLKHGRYFNSGMMLIDIQRWNEQQVSQRALATLLQPPCKLEYPDQDVLNLTLDGQTDFVAPRWNLLYDMGSTRQPIPDDTVILHYFCALKPWYDWCEHPMQQPFIHYAQQSPWKNVALYTPVHYQDRKSYAKVLRTRGQYWQATLWYLRYLAGSLTHKRRKPT